MRGVTPRRSRTQGRGRAGPGSGASTAAINTTRNGENTGTCKAALQAALAHPLARPPLALAESGLLDTVPVVLVRLVVSRVVGRLGHAAKGHGTHHMRKAVRSCNAGGRGVSQLSERAGAAMPCNNPTPRIASSPLIVSRPRQPKRLCVSRLTSTTDAGDHRLATGATAQRHPGSPGSPSYPFFLRASPRPQAWRSRAYITFQSTCGPKEGRERKRTSAQKHPTSRQLSHAAMPPLNCSRSALAQEQPATLGVEGLFFENANTTLHALGSRAERMVHDAQALCTPSL